MQHVGAYQTERLVAATNGTRQPYTSSLPMELKAVRFWETDGHKSNRTEDTGRIWSGAPICIHHLSLRIIIAGIIPDVR